jgi:hypothetical protein
MAEPPAGCQRVEGSHRAPLPGAARVGPVDPRADRGQHLPARRPNAPRAEKLFLSYLGLASRAVWNKSGGIETTLFDILVCSLQLI